MDLDHQENKLDIDKIKINGVIKELKEEIYSRLYNIRNSAEKASLSDYKDLEKELNNIDHLSKECRLLFLELKIYNQRL